jgi:hypothetical protein
MNFSAGEMFGADEIAVSLVGISQVWNLDKHRQGPNLIGELIKRCKPPKARVPSFHLIPMKFSGFPGWESSRLEPCQTPTRSNWIGTNGNSICETRILDIVSLVRASPAWNVGKHRHCSKPSNSKRNECA